MDNYSILIHGILATCPECSGVMTKQTEMMYSCKDCGGKYKITGLGMTEREMMVSKMTAKAAS